jgi:putative FmdB family regulatory protein
MPIYEYLCPDCDLEFELRRPFSEADGDAPCPRCQNHARRTVTACAVFSRGEGGKTSRVAGTGGSCGGCASSHCSTCGH